MEILCLGISHKTSSVETREKFALGSQEMPAALSRLRELGGVDGSVILSTCNRVEFYAEGGHASEARRAIERFVLERFGRDMEAFSRYETEATVRHLFRVVSGLESMVLGETEVLGQVKKAYAESVENGGSSRHLNKLFQRAFQVAKEVRSKTNITRGPVSVGSVAVELAQKIFGDLSDRTVMILGAGDTSERTARALFSRGARSIFVSNRSYDRAAVLASELGGKAIHFDEWHKSFQNIDVLISSTSAPHPIVTVEKLAPVMRNRYDRPLFLIDIAVPRDIEPGVNELEGVYLYDIDALQAIANQALEVRERDLAWCEQIIDGHVADFCEWLQRDQARAHLRDTDTGVPAGPSPVSQS